MTLSVLTLALSCFLVAGTPASQEHPLTGLATELTSSTDRVQKLRQEISLIVGYIANTLTAQPSTDEVQIVEANRTDKQSGADPGNGASTSLVSSGSVPSVIGFAVENGGLTQSVSGTTITIRGNPYGLIQMGLGELEEAFGVSDVPKPGNYLRRFSFSASFDASRGTGEGEDPVFRGDRQQLSAFSFRYEPLNHRAPWTSAYQTRFKMQVDKLLADPLQDLATAGSELRAEDDDWFTEDRVRDWANETARAWGGAVVTETMLEVAAEDLKVRILENLKEGELAAFREALEQHVNANNAVDVTRSAILETLNQGSILAVEYGNDRPLELPSTHTLRLIAETPLGRGWGFTANADVRLWDSTQPFSDVGVDIDTLRDWSLAAEFKKPLGAIAQGRPLIFTGALRAGQVKSVVMAEEMMDGMGDAGSMMMMGTMDEAMSAAMRVMPANESRWIVQFKLTIPVKEAGVRVPISLSISDRPELLEMEEKDVRGTIGFTFDLDSLIGGALAGS